MPVQLSAAWRRWWWLILAFLIGIAVCRLWPGRPPLTTAFRCPEHSIQIVAFDTVITSIPIAPQTGPIPEYHDCQRMEIGRDYGPLIAIWGAQDLADFFPPLPAGGHDGIAYAVAQILDLGNGPRGDRKSDDYAPLSIQSGLSCIYLWRTAAPDSFQARIVHQDDEAALYDCKGPHALDRRVLGGQPLSVHVIRDDGLEASAIPPVARWDQDPVGHAQYIGLRCGDAWCEIGPRDGFTSSRAALAEPAIAAAVQAAYEPDAAYPVPPTRWRDVQLVKGWYDQQELGVWNSSNQLAPSGVVGTIIPNPVLDVIGKEGTDSGPKFYHRWVPSAYVYVTGNYNGKQLQLERGVSRLYVCKGYFGDCPGVKLTTSDSDSMWSKLVGPSGATVYHSVEYNEHGGGVIPAGAARWRWLETDETTWVRCEDGCCTNK